MSTHSKNVKKTLKYPLLIGGIVGILLMASIVVPLTSNDAFGAVWKPKARTSISLTTDSSSYQANTNVHIEGLLASASSLAKGNVTLKVQLPSGAVSYPVQGSSTAIDGNGSFDVDLVPTSPGTFKVMASYAGDSTHSSCSRSLSVVVTAGTTATRWTWVQVPGSISVGQGATYSARFEMTDPSGVYDGVDNADVSYMFADANDRVTTIQAKTGTDGSGISSVVFTPHSAGNWTVRCVSTVGGQDYAMASSMVESTVAEQPVNPPETPSDNGSENTTDPGDTSDPTDPGATTDPTPVISAKYTVTSSGSSCVVKNADGSIVYSNANPATAIQWALNGLTSGRTAKETVLVQGSFVLTTSLKLSSYTTIILDGKLTMGVNSNTHMLEATSRSCIEVTGGEWDANQDNNSLGGTERRALDFAYCTDVYVHDLKVHDAAYGNLECLGCSYVTIRNVESYNVGDWDLPSDQIRTAWRGPGIQLAWSNYCIVENCYIHDTSSGGCYFYTEDDSTAQTISNNIMRNNRVERTTTSGLSISLRGAEDIGTNNLIENNTCIDCGTDGAHPGINIGWFRTDVVLSASYCTVRGNEVYETGKYACGGGISIESHDCIVTNNKVHDLNYIGILCRGPNNVVSYNSIYDIASSSRAIQVYGGDDNQVIYNHIWNCVRGISLFSSGTTDGNVMAYNTIEGATTYAVGIHSSVTNTVVENNTFRGGSQISDSGTGTVIRSNASLS